MKRFCNTRSLAVFAMVLLPIHGAYAGIINLRIYPTQFEMSLKDVRIEAAKLSAACSTKSILPGVAPEGYQASVPVDLELKQTAENRVGFFLNDLVYLSAFSVTPASICGMVLHLDAVRVSTGERKTQPIRVRTSLQGDITYEGAAQFDGATVIFRPETGTFGLERR